MVTTGIMGQRIIMTARGTRTGRATTTTRGGTIATTTIVHGGTAIGITGNLIAAAALPPVATFRSAFLRLCSRIALGDGGFAIRA